MKEEFLRHLSRKKLCSREDKIILAVSGGIDSMVMTYLFRECGFDISVAHANFQLRGHESEADTVFVKNYCEKASIPFFTKRFNTEEYATNHSLSIQMAARELRYTWFDELLQTRQFSFIATAHHLNDSIETTLLNLTRGSGIEGLDGIPAKNKKIIRPLLFATKKQIEIYAKEHNIRWREDSSNFSDEYQRNFIRHKLVPLLNELNPSLEHSFQHSAEKISAAQELMNLGLKHWRNDFETKKDGKILLTKDGFKNLENPGVVLWYLIKTYGFNSDQAEQAVIALPGQPGKKFFSHEYELVVDRDHLIISKQEGNLPEIAIQKNQAEAQLGKYVLKIVETTSKEISKDPFTANIDLVKVQFPITWRKWKSGDHFHPLGMTHTKKLSDFFIDQKISVSDKESITVLESGNEIIWVVGHRIDDRYKITDSSKRILKMEVTSSR